MDLSRFEPIIPGRLVEVRGSDSRFGDWEHRAFVPNPLETKGPELTTKTFNKVAAARAALAELNTVSGFLPNPKILRYPTLRREAQATSALEGTFAPTEQVLIANKDSQSSTELKEIMNFTEAANHGFDWVSEARPITVTFLCALHRMLMRGTGLEKISGQVRDTQVFIGQRSDAQPGIPSVLNAQFVPAPPGDELNNGLNSFADWFNDDHSADLDPVVAAAMAHYQFETIHPFPDGNGRIGRLLIILYFQLHKVISEPNLMISPWFEARRAEYYEHLLRVSTNNDWDNFINFFAEGIEASAKQTRLTILELVDIQTELKNQIIDSSLRADTAQKVIDLAIAELNFTISDVEHNLGISYTRSSELIRELLNLGLLAEIKPRARTRRFYAPLVHEALAR